MRLLSLLPVLIFFSALCRADLLTTELAQQPVTDSRQFDGLVEAIHSATVSGQTSGRVADILFDIGDDVAAGATIIRLVSEDQQGDLQQAQAAVAEARAGLKVEQLEYQRIQSLFNQGVLPRADLDRAKGKVESREAQVTSAEGALRRARQQLSYTVVKAPFSGRVSERHVELGEAVAPGVPLMSGFDPQQLRVVVDIPQHLASRLPAQPQIKVISDTLEISPLSLQVYPVANPHTGAVTLRLQLPAGDHGLLPGQWVKVSLATGSTMRLLIPQSAVLQRAQISNVFISNNGAIELRNVRLGQRYGDQVAVTAGLQAGELLVLNPLQALLQQHADKGDRNE